jgi:hypothetical protein
MNFILDNIFKIAFVFTFVIYFIALFKVGYFYFYLVKKWAKTEAEVISSEQYYDDTYDSEGIRNNIVYSFDYNSQIFEGNCISKNFQIMTTFKTSFNENNFKKGQKIIITFNPDIPAESVIEDKFDLMNILFPALIFIPGYYFLF